MTDFFSAYDNDGAVASTPEKESRSQNSGYAYSEELFSRKIEAQNKTYFIDLKLSVRGKFLKISERSNGRKSTIMIDADHLPEMFEIMSRIESTDLPETLSEEESHAQEVLTEKLEVVGRTYFFDLKVSNRGVFLKISERSNGRKNTVMLDAEYFLPLFDILKEVQSVL